MKITFLIFYGKDGFQGYTARTMEPVASAHGNGDDGKVGTEALQYVKDHRKELVRDMMKSYRESHTERPLSIFLAGSPGAGKTEYGISLIAGAHDILRIEADAVREWLPMYKGANASLLQQATSKGVDILVDHALEHGVSFLLDATFTPLRIAERNVDRCLSRDRIVQVHYVYQDPLIAWAFTKKREEVEGRSVPQEAFILKFLEAGENVQKILRKHGDAVDCTLVIKNFAGGERRLFEHVQTLENLLPMQYNATLLKKLLPKL